MNVEQLKIHLDYLVDKYVTDSETKGELKNLIQREAMPPVKYIMAEIESKGRSIEQMDTDLVKDIAYYYL